MVVLRRLFTHDRSFRGGLVVWRILYIVMNWDKATQNHLRTFKRNVSFAQQISYPPLFDNR
jgi:hypothetical protein